MQIRLLAIMATALVFVCRVTKAQTITSVEIDVCDADTVALIGWWPGAESNHRHADSQFRSETLSPNSSEGYRDVRRRRQSGQNLAGLLLLQADTRNSCGR